MDPSTLSQILIFRTVKLIHTYVSEDVYFQQRSWIHYTGNSSSVSCNACSTQCSSWSHKACAARCQIMGVPWKGCL